MSLHSNHLVSAFIGALISGVMVCLHQSAPRIAVVDMQRLLNQPAVLLSHSKLSENMQKSLLKRYSSLLPKVLSEYGKEHQVTLITATVISPGALDVTDEVIGVTLEKLKSS